MSGLILSVEDRRIRAENPPVTYRESKCLFGVFYSPQNIAVFLSQIIFLFFVDKVKKHA